MRDDIDHKLMARHEALLKKRQAKRRRELMMKADHAIYVGPYINEGPSYPFHHSVTPEMLVEFWESIYTNSIIPFDERWPTCFWRWLKRLRWPWEREEGDFTDGVYTIKL